MTFTVFFIRQLSVLGTWWVLQSTSSWDFSVCSATWTRI